MEINPLRGALSYSPPIENEASQVLQKQPFISALVQLKNMLKKIFGTDSEDTAASGSYKTSLFNDSTSITPDIFHFGIFSHAIEQLTEEGQLLPLIQERRTQMGEQKDHWHAFIDTSTKGEDRDFYSAVAQILEEGKLIANPDGAGSAYFLVDRNEVPRYVIKPVDEDIFCLNNRKNWGSPFIDQEHRARDAIPLYRSAQTDAFCWEIAKMAGIRETTPHAVIGIIQDDGFYDFTTWLDVEEREKFLSETGWPDKEKLCSFQEFIPDAQELADVLQKFYHEGLTDEEIASHFDQKDFEEVCLLLWLTYDTDGHGSNFLTFVKRAESGKNIYGIKKIDNGLSFPEKNTQYTNILTWFPNAMRGISPELKQKIANLPLDQILQKMDAYELSDCKEAFKERVEILKTLAQRDGITIGEIDLRFLILSNENGKELVLSPLSTQEILDQILGDYDETN